MDLIKELTKSQLKEMPPVLVGDTVRVRVVDSSSATLIGELV